MRQIRFLLLLLAVLMSPGLALAASNLSIEVPSGTGETTSVELYSASHALVIGIDKYTGGWRPLSNAVKDARAVAAAMEAAGYEVTLLTDLDREDLVRQMRAFFIGKGDDPNARLFMWFAGHGHTENGEGFIIPADGKLPEAGADFRFSAVPIRDVSTYLRLAQSKHVLSVFDSCFAGTVFGGNRSAGTEAISRATTRPVRQFLTSGDAYQEVADDGTFRELFIRLITGSENGDLDGDGYVTATELGLNISNRMTNLSEGRQTPQYGKLRDKDYDLGEYVLAAAAPTVKPRSTAGIVSQNRVIEALFSEENPPSNCPAGYALKGLQCSGAYCDAKRLICAQFDPSGADPGAQLRWSRPFSEEPENSETSTEEFVAGMACSGWYCDTLKLRFLKSPGLGKPANCSWTPDKLSEEEGERVCSGDKFVAGVKCTGWYCDNLNLYCCDAVK